MGNKVVALLSLLALSVNQGDKMLVFSQSLDALNLIEMFLAMHDWGSKVKGNCLGEEHIFISCFAAPNCVFYLS